MNRILFLYRLAFQRYVVCSNGTNTAKPKDFVATASHELKSPLAVMISNTDML